VEIEYAISTFISIMAIVNPMGAVSNYVGLTQGFSRKEKKEVIKRAVLVGAVTLIVITFIGKAIFDFFSITVDSFRVGGGVILFLIAMDMVRGTTSPAKLTDKEKIDSIERAQIGVIPLGIPLLAGPGAITSVMIAMSDTSQGYPALLLVVVTSILIVMTISFLILRQADLIFDRIGRAGTKIFSRLMGLILAAIAVQFMANGIIGLFNL